MNRSGELASWDEDALTKLLAGLRAEDALDGIGYDESEIDELLAELDAIAQVEDPGPEGPPEDPVSRKGDTWLLGPHRVVCEDATTVAAWSLLEPVESELVFTDPPYGVSYEGGTERHLTIQNDEPGRYEAVLREGLGFALKACRPGAVWYVAAPSGPALLPFYELLTKWGVLRQALVWVKDSFVLGHSDFHYRHEMLLYGWKPGASHRAPSVRNLDSVWEYDRPRRSEEHPTMKPVELIERALQISSAAGAEVLDPFLGSGSTLLACERTGRECFGIEIDPRYVDVAVKRWQEATGKPATLKGTGRTFEEIADERRPK